MRTISNIKTIATCEKTTYVLVSWVGEINTIMNEYPNKDIIFRLLLHDVDEELLNLLESIPYKIEIIYQSQSLEDQKLKLLHNYQERTNSKVYISYNVDTKSPFERANLIYYLNRYNLISLLDSSNQDTYQDWAKEMTKYTSKNKVRKLNRQYINT